MKLGSIAFPAATLALQAVAVVPSRQDPSFPAARGRFGLALQ